MRRRLPDRLRARIIECLQPLSPELVVLFGSYASGTADADSDIDLYVVTREERIPQDYESRMRLHREVARALSPVSRDKAVDLIVHTHGMHARFLELGSSFARTLTREGVRLL